MRVLAITNMLPTPTHPTGGIYVEEQVRSLRAVGVQVNVLFVDRLRSGPFIYYRMGRDLKQAMRQFNPELIHVMYGGLMAHQITREANLPRVVVTFHGSDLLGENLSGWVRKLLSHYGIHCSKMAAQRAAGVVVVAAHLLNRLPGGYVVAARYGGDRPSVPSESPSTRVVKQRSPNVRVIPCGIDLDVFQPMDSGRCRSRLGWQPDHFHVVFATNNGDPVKRPHLAQAAVDVLNRSGVRSELHCMSGIGHSEVPVWLNASDVLLLTSLHEGSPTIVKEALACALPVVSVDVGDVAERIADIVGCYLAAPVAADLGDKLAQVAARRQRLNCRNQVEQFSLSNVAQQLKGFYRELLAFPR